MLSEAEKDDEVILLNIEDNIELYDYLRELDIIIKESYIVTKKDPFKGPIYLQNGEGKIKILAYNASELIEVYRKKKDEEIDNLE